LTPAFAAMPIPKLTAPSPAEPPKPRNENGTRA
jgi:hypothetical protein